MTSADDPEGLDNTDGDLLFYEAYREGNELIVTLRRQFALLQGDEDEESRSPAPRATYEVRPGRHA